VGGSLGDLNSANRYVYAGDDPVNAVDPSGASLSPAGTAAVILGLIPASPIFAICAGVAALGAAYETAVAFFFG